MINVQYAHDACMSLHIQIPLPTSRTTKHTLTRALTHTHLRMPSQRGTIARWAIQEGERVEAGDVLADVETDKATVAFESVEEGYLAKILVPEGSTDVEVGTLVAILAEEQEDVAAFANFTDDGSSASTSATPAAAAEPTPEPTPAPVTPAPTPAAASPAAAAPAPAPATSGERVKATPLARSIAAEQGIDLSQVAGTGPARRIIADDVREYVPAPAAAAAATVSTPAPVAAAAAPAAAPAAPAVDGHYTDLPLSGVRKVIAQRLTESKTQIPHYYLSVSCNMDSILKLRAELNEKQAKKDGVKLSVNDFVIKAAALAARAVPECNSSWQGDSIRQYNYVDMSVAVSTDGGLITPIVQDADLKGLSAISADVKDLATRARHNKLAPHEYQGGTFTISNLGMFGVNNFSAIINPPQSCILAVGTTETRVVPTGDADTPFGTSQFMNVTLSADHRVVDGAVGAAYLKELRAYMEDPVTMLL